MICLLIFTKLKSNSAYIISPTADGAFLIFYKIYNNYIDFLKML